MKKWDHRFIDLAAFVAAWSKDPSTKVGAVIAKDRQIISLGFNGFPPGMADDDRLFDREMKLQMILHAEDNALSFAGANAKGCAIYTWPMPPCAGCAAKIARAGIIRVVAPAANDGQIERWRKSFDLAESIYKEAGIDFKSIARTRKRD